MRAKTVKHMIRWAGMLSIVGILAVSGLQAFAALQGRPILEVSGSIENNSTAVFDIAALERIGVTEIQTSTPWTEGRPVFEGVLLSDLMNSVGAQGTVVLATALNDYRVEIPLSDFDRYPVVLAYKMNGEMLKVRDKGPLWIIYPQDEYPELQTKQVQSRWVWQIKELKIQ